MYLEDKLDEINRKLDDLDARLKAFNRTPTQELLDNQDVMQLLKISPRTLQNYRDMGLIPFYKLEGKIYYIREEVLETIRNNKGSF